MSTSAPVLVRFAPSPTGLLHVGNARVALINWLFARAHGGAMLLRYDDTDTERSTGAFAMAIDRDLRWLGLDWSIQAAQSARLADYQAAADKLKAAGRLYACYETADELDFKRKYLRSRGLPPVYDRAHLTLSDAEKAAFEAEGRKPHWRFLLNREAVAWDDLVHGPVSIDCSTLSDPVLIRADGTFLYTLPSVVDDAEFKVTHVIRGEDHVTNTAPQIQIFQALGATPPAFAHLPLLVGADGSGLSKRLGSMSLQDLAAEGIEPMALNSLLAKMGSSDAIEVRDRLEALVAEFDIQHFSRSTPRFDPQELAHLNARLLHSLPFDVVADRLPAGADAAFWLAVRGNLGVLADAAHWWQVLHGHITPVVEDAAVLGTAAALLPPEPWDETTWKQWTDAVKAETGLKGRALFHPLRLALTGQDKGPEMHTLLLLMGRNRALPRLCGQEG